MLTLEGTKERRRLCRAPRGMHTHSRAHRWLPREQKTRKGEGGGGRGDTSHTTTTCTPPPHLVFTASTGMLHNHVDTTHQHRAHVSSPTL
jgi:hypothetical protein